jgi:pilus assembly protein Flp/PilA
MALSRKLLICVRRLWRQEDGPTAAEYAVLLCLIVVALIGSIMGLSQSIRQVFAAASQAFTLPA